MEDLLSIGNVAKLVGVEVHTIRFWTDEFKEFVSFKIGKGERRYYTQATVLTFLKIKKLIHEDGIKIKIIREKKLLDSLSPKKEKIIEIKNYLLEIKEDFINKI